MSKETEPYAYEPVEVQGMVKIESRLFVQTRWSSNNLHYVPYDFIKEHYPRLLTNYLVQNTQQMSLLKKKKKR